MAKAIVGVIGGSGVYHLEGMSRNQGRASRDALGRALRRSSLRPHRGHAGGVPVAARPGPPLFAVHDQLSRQYRRAQARRASPTSSRSPPAAPFAGNSIPGCSCSSINSRTGPSRARRAFSARAASRMSRWPTRSRRCCSRRVAAAARGGGNRLPSRGNLCLHGRAAILDARRIAGLSGARRRRDRHDCRDRGQARARGRNLLCDDRDGHRLRLLARGTRRGGRRVGHEGGRTTTPSASTRWWRGFSATSPPSTKPCPIGSDRALEGAIMTHPDARDPELMRKLDAVAGRVIGPRS